MLAAFMRPVELARHLGMTARCVHEGTTLKVV
jgi:hypothetical protein